MRYNIFTHIFSTMLLTALPFYFSPLIDFCFRLLGEYAWTFVKHVQNAVVVPFFMCLTSSLCDNCNANECSLCWSEIYALLVRNICLKKLAHILQYELGFGDCHTRNCNNNYTCMRSFSLYIRARLLQLVNMTRDIVLIRICIRKYKYSFYLFVFEFLIFIKSRKIDLWSLIF